MFTLPRFIERLKSKLRSKRGNLNNRTVCKRFNVNPISSHQKKFRWGLVKAPSCDYGLEPQTAELLIHHCPIHRPKGGNVNLTALDETTIQWL